MPEAMSPHLMPKISWPLKRMWSAFTRMIELHDKMNHIQAITSQDKAILLITLGFHNTPHKNKKG
jgi:predicted secreted Zn-dependent protease